MLLISLLHGLAENRTAYAHREIDKRKPETKGEHRLIVEAEQVAHDSQPQKDGRDRHERNQDA